ncbi:hypothetical protein [Rhodococcus sp. IEGM 1408]|nr:hypothetical protein [Rhodococcus sp. IEGM 1408]MDV7999748.1 hypothetical protein [Rhodococcus sp. IEGM 1408]
MERRSRGEASSDNTNTGETPDNTNSGKNTLGTITKKLPRR